MDALLRDLRYSLRRLRHTPAFTATVILTLALGIGANTAIFSVVNTVLLRPLGYRDPGQLVAIFHFYPSLSDMEAPVSAIGYRDYRDKTRSFEAVAVGTGWAANLTGTQEPERVPASRVSGLYFKALGVAPQLGRTLLPEEDEPGKHRVVVIADGLWRRAFGADKAIVGKPIQLNGEDYTVVGIMPPGFKDFWNTRAEIWRPLALDPGQFNTRAYTNEYLSVVARLKTGVTPEAAQREMTAFATNLKREYPDNFGETWTLKVKTFDEIATGKIRPALLVLLGAVGFVLLIACANVANLLLARAAARMKEVAIRAALGADRWSLVRQLLAESVLLSLFGALVGLGLAFWLVKTLVVAIPNLPRADEIRIDGVVMAFTLLVAVATGLLFGLAPALQMAKANLHDTLKEGGRSGAADVSGNTLRRSLVVAEVALALTLLVGAGLLIRSVAMLQKVDPGFVPDRLLTFNVSLPATGYPNDTARAQFFDRVIPVLSAVPGVQAVGATSVMPFGGGWSTGSFRIEGYTTPEGQNGPWGDVRIVSNEFLQTMKVPLVSGRLLGEQDVMSSQPVVVIDDEFAKKYYKGQDPIGKRITFGPPPGDTIPRWITIVGVVKHTMHEGLDAEPRIQLYLPYRQRPTGFLTFAVRTAGEDPLALTNAIRGAVRSVDANMPISNVRTMDDLLDSSLGQRKLSMWLLGGYAAIALLLASIGIYGVMSYSVTQRQRELGIRMALGAARGRVLGLVVRQGMGLVILGLVIGIGAALALTRFIEKQLFNVTATDPLTFALVAGTLGGVALVATMVPALRATRVDPIVVLRDE